MELQKLKELLTQEEKAKEQTLGISADFTIYYE